MQCPKCSTDAGESEFCPSCLTVVGAPKAKGEQLEEALKQKELEAREKARAELQRSGRQTIIWAGALTVAIALGVAIAGVIGAYSDPPAPPANPFREPRVRCGRDADCGDDPCKHPMRCVDRACQRDKTAPCTESQASPHP